MEVLLYFGLPIKNEHDDFSCPQKFIAYPQPHEILKCHNYFVWFYLLIVIDKIMIKLYKEFCENSVELI